MKKLLAMFLIIVSGTFSLVAQETELGNYKPVTSKWSYVSGTAEYADHYLNNQQYSGDISGIEAIHGRFFKKSDNLSWKLSLNHLRKMHTNYFGEGLINAANTSYISTQSYEADYAVHYNWLFNDRLQVRAGGSFNVYGGFIMGDKNAVNNILCVDLQTQFKGSVEVRYGWDFEKFGLDIYANAAAPLFGLMAVDERYESFMATIPNSEFNLKEYNHFVFSSWHNNQGMNFEMGVDFALKRLSLCISYEERNRWWNAYELQCYRKNSLLKLGISVNLVSHQNHKTGDRKF